QAPSEGRTADKAAPAPRRAFRRLPPRRRQAGAKLFPARPDLGRKLGDRGLQPPLDGELGLALGAGRKVGLDARAVLTVQPTGRVPGQQELRLAVLVRVQWNDLSRHDDLTASPPNRRRAWPSDAGGRGTCGFS